MSAKLAIRNTQTKVKHEILEKYLKAWGGIIINGVSEIAKRLISQGKTFDLHLVYVDCFSYIGRYAGEQEDSVGQRTMQAVFGSPVIGVRSLDTLARWATSMGVPVRTNSILVEIDVANYKELLCSLELAGLRDRACETDNFSSLQDGEISVVNCDSTLISQKLTAYTQAAHTHSLYLLDPYGPMGIPLSFVQEIISRNRHDVIINMPYQDLHKKTGIAVKSILESSEAAIASNYDRMFGSREWRTIAQDLQKEDVCASARTQKLEIQLAELYRDVLNAADPNLAVKSMPLRFSDKDRTMFYLYLTTHDADGALSMNKVLNDAGYLENDLRLQVSHARVTGTGQAALFDEMPPAPRKRRDEVSNIADILVSKMSGTIVTRKAVYKVMADSPYFATEINKALTLLLRQQRASYQTPLKNDSLITFR